jgi:hypothetical protein
MTNGTCDAALSEAVSMNGVEDIMKQLAAMLGPIE